MRRRLLLIIGALTLLLVVLTAWGFHALASVHDHGRAISHFALVVVASTLVILMAFMFTIILCLGAAFLGALSTGTEIENGTLLAIAPRPLRRWELLAGKWLGNAAILAAYAAVSGALEVAVVYKMTGYAPPHPLAAILFLIAQALFVLTFTMWLSIRLSAIAAGFTTTVLFGLARVVGAAGIIGQALHNTTVTQAAVVASLIVPFDGLWRAAVYQLEPAAMIATASSTGSGGNPFIELYPPTVPYLLWCGLWFSIVSGLAISAFARRDL